MDKNSFAALQAILDGMRMPKGVGPVRAREVTDSRGESVLLVSIPVREGRGKPTPELVAALVALRVELNTALAPWTERTGVHAVLAFEPAPARAGGRAGKLNVEDFDREMSEEYLRLFRKWLDNGDHLVGVIPLLALGVVGGGVSPDRVAPLVSEALGVVRRSGAHTLIWESPPPGVSPGQHLLQALARDTRG